MIRVSRIWNEAKRIVGNHDDAYLFQRITDAVELLANKGDWDPLLGTLDICASSRVVSLPPEVETILALNMLGRPAVARDELFQFHINGPGSCGNPIRYEWTDMADACTYRELLAPSHLIAYCTETEDVGKELRVYGFDEHNNVLRTKTANGWEDGWIVPVNKTFVAVSSEAPKVLRITAVRKAETAGPVRLSAIDEDGEIALGVYQSNETAPQFRRIVLSTCADWVRIRFRRRTFEVRSKNDLLPLHNAQAIIMALRALKAYDTPSMLAEAEAYEATAVRWVTEEQFTRTPPVVHPIQVLDAAPLSDTGDEMD